MDTTIHGLGFLMEIMLDFWIGLESASTSSNCKSCTFVISSLKIKVEMEVIEVKVEDSLSLSDHNKPSD